MLSSGIKEVFLIRVTSIKCSSEKDMFYASLRRSYLEVLRVYPTLNGQ